MKRIVSAFLAWALFVAPVFAASGDARPVPRKNIAMRITFGIYDADGDPVAGATGLDSERSCDAGTYADVTAEATEIATSSGTYYLDLTAAEMNCDTVSLRVLSTSSGSKDSILVMYPESLGDIRTNVGQWNGTAVATPDTAGYPVCTVKDGTGAGELATTSGALDTVTTHTNERGTDSAALATVCTEARLAELDAPNLPTDVAANATPSEVATELGTYGALKPTVAGRTADVTVGGTVGADLGNVEGTLDAAEIGADAITAAKIAAAAITSSEAPNLDQAVSGNASPAEVNAELVNEGLDHLVQVAVSDTDIADNSVIARLADNGATADFTNYDQTAHSLKAIRIRGDASWITGGGGGITDILNVQPLLPESIDLANTVTWRLGLMLTNALDDLPTTAEITPGTIDIHRKAAGGTSWSSVVSAAAATESAGLVYYDEVFDSGTGYAEGDSIRVTWKSQKITVAANDYEVTDATGRSFYTEIRASGGAADWTATEKNHLRYRLQIDGTQAAPAADAPTQLPVDAQALDGSTANAADLGDFAAAGYNPATDEVLKVGTAATCTSNTDMVGTDGALLAASAPTNFGDLSISATTGLVTPGTAGYLDGSVWIDTNGANTGTVLYDDGTADNPVNALADATTIAVALGIKRFSVQTGSLITLAQSYDNYTFYSRSATIALGGQSISGAVFIGSKITGNDDGTTLPRSRFVDCDIASNTLGQFVMLRSRLTGTLTLAEAGSYFLEGCYSGVAGTSTPVLDFGSLLAASNVNMRHYSGGIEIANMGAGAGSYNMSLEGFGQLVIAASCSATSTVAIRGAFTISDLAGGAVTLSDDARIDVAQVNAEADLALADYDGPTKAEQDAGFTEIKGPTWSSPSDTLEGIRDVTPHGSAMRGTDSGALASVATEARLAELDGANIPARLPSALVGGKMDASVGAIVAAALAQFFSVDSGTTYGAAVAGSPVKEIADNASVTLGTDSITADVLAADAVDEIVDQAWDELIAGHLGAGSTGAALNAAGGAGDPWITAIPGAYAPGSAGYLAGTRLALIGVVSAAIQNILSADLDIGPIVQGMDYLAADGLEARIDLTGEPSITGATLLFTMLQPTDAGSFTKAGVVVDGDTFYVEFTAAETATFATPGTFRYDVLATLASGSKRVVVSGEVSTTSSP